MLKIFNTLTRKKEEFVPLEREIVTMYSCGPTVYNYAHIGNLRTYVFMDLVRRVLKANHYRLKGVLNITDVGHLVSDGDDGEDKMNVAAARTGQTPAEIAAHYTEVFFADLKKLGIEKPEIIARATDHIADMLEFVVALVEKGVAYETADGVYFDIAKFPEYGKLSGIKLEEQMAGARVDVNADKRNAADFALWKKAPKEHIMQWDSPWGKSFPGWHIECSAMSRKYLGDIFDIHTGGVDHIPIHHENEIAQSESLLGHKAVNYWMHGEFMLVDGGKMSKSLGNTYTVGDLEQKGYSPLDFRYFCLNTHYRKKLNFTWEGLDAARTARLRLGELVAACRDASSEMPAAAASHLRADFSSAVNDDINVPLALGVIWKSLKSEKPSDDLYRLMLEFDAVLGLDLASSKVAPPQDSTMVEVPDEVAAIAEKRLAAKRNKDYAIADALRGEAARLGFEIIDTKDGYNIKQLTIKN